MSFPSWLLITSVIVMSSIGRGRLPPLSHEPSRMGLRTTSSEISVAEPADQVEPSKEDRQGSKKTDLITVTGCVSRLNSNFILEESARSHSYQLQGGEQLKLENYLGKEVEVSGTETTPMTTSSPRASTANPVALDIHSIKLLQPRCPAH